MPLSDTVSNAEQRLDEQRSKVNDALDEQRAKVNEALDTGRARLRAVVDEAVEVTEGGVEHGTSTLMEQVKIWRERSLDDLGRLNTVVVEATASMAKRLPRAELPLVGKLPAADQVIGDGFDYAIALAKLQKKFALDLVTATRAEAPPAKKASSKKAAAKAA